MNSALRLLAAAVLLLLLIAGACRQQAIAQDLDGIERLRDQKEAKVQQQKDAARKKAPAGTPVASADRAAGSGGTPRR